MSNQQAFHSLIIRQQCNPLPISAVTKHLVAISSYVLYQPRITYRKKMFVTAITADVTTGTGTEESQWFSLTHKCNYRPLFIK